MAISYHNSLYLDQNLVRDYEKKNKSQEEFIYAIFLQHKRLTKSDLLITFENLGFPITEMSISRSLTNLQTEEKIIKTDDKKIGVYKVPNSIYRLIEPNDVIPPREHRLKLTSTECKTLGTVINSFIEQNIESDEFGDDIWNAIKSITDKLNNINYK
jgi:hypothetical protein